MSKRTPGDRLTPDEIDDIIELKLDRVPVRDICTRVGCAIETVLRHWNAWLDDASEERRTKLERHQTEIMVRLDHIAADARRGARRAQTSPSGAGECPTRTSPTRSFPRNPSSSAYRSR